jgi:hypothetical protein
MGERCRLIDSREAARETDSEPDDHEERDIRQVLQLLPLQTSRAPQPDRYRGEAQHDPEESERQRGAQVKPATNGRLAMPMGFGTESDGSTLGWIRGAVTAMSTRPITMASTTPAAIRHRGEGSKPLGKIMNTRYAPGTSNAIRQPWSHAANARPGSG